jgi:hypothetical protein
MALSAALVLWLSRGTSFFSDEFTYFVASRGFDPNALLSPHNGHLVAGVRLVYATVFALFGADYLVFRLLEAFGVVLVAGLFFVLAKRRVGPAIALPPSILLLFFGSAADDTLSPLGITHVYCVAAGLGALIALERDDRRGDLAGCALLVIAVATFSIGLAFLAGAAVAVLMRGDRWRRAWIFLIPAGLYIAWAAFAPKLTGPTYHADIGLRLTNALTVPNFVADAAAAAAAAVAGLARNFTTSALTGAGSAPDLAPEWGYPIVIVAGVGLGLRLRRGGVPSSLWVSLAVLLAFWTSTAMVTTLNRYPTTERYAYAGAVAMLLVAADALSGVEIPRRLAPVLLPVTALALAGNIYTFRTSSGVIRSYSATDRAALAAIELARGRVPGDFVPSTPSIAVNSAYQVVGGAGPVLAAVDRNGSFAFSLPQLREQPEDVREVADSTLAQALGLRLEPARSAGALTGCRRVPASTPIVLRPPGVLLRAVGTERVTLRRFAAVPTARVGSLRPGGAELLRIPADRAPEAWHAELSPGGPATICGLAR